MRIKLVGARRCAMLLALAILALPGLAHAKIQAPLSASLDVATTPTLGGRGVALWTGLPRITPQAAEVVFSLSAPGAAAPATTVQRVALTAGKTAAVSFQFATPAPGRYTITATANLTTDGGSYAKVEKLILDVPASGAVKLSAEKPLSAAERQAGAPKARTPKLASAAPLSATNFGAFTVSGTLKYTDKVQGASGYTRTATLPMRRVEVDICDVKGTGSRVLATTLTNDSGYFSYTLPNNNDGNGTGYDIFLQVFAGSATTPAKVMDMDGYVYYSETSHIPDWAGGALSLGTVIFPVGDSAQWNIYDTLLRGYDTVKSFGETPPQVRLKWAVNNDAQVDVTHYDPASNYINLQGSSQDPDEFDDAVILHEYGHFLETKMGYSKNPGGNHDWSVASSAPLAWSEGWSTFFSSVVRKTYNYFDYTPNGSIAINIEIPTSNPRGDKVEGAVAASLWDIYDVASDRADTLNDGMSHIWRIFSYYFNSSRACVMSDFYNGWKSYGYANLSKVQAILSEHGIRYGWTDPVMVFTFAINNGAASTTNRTVTLNNSGMGSPAYYMASESSAFSGASWKTYSSAPSFTIASAGGGTKTVYFKTKNSAGTQSAAKSDTITLNEAPPVRPSVTSFAINNGAASTSSRVVTLNNACSNSPRYYMASESPTFTGDAVWYGYSANPTFTIKSAGNGTKTIYFQVVDSTYALISNRMSDTITLNEVSTPVVSSFTINSSAASTANRNVILNNSCSGGPAYYMASESSAFTGAVWLSYGSAPAFKIASGGNGTKTVYFKVKNAAGVQSAVKSDTILLQESSNLTIGSTWVAGNIAMDADYDRYTFTVATSGWYTIETAAGALADGYMYLFDSSGKRIGESDDQASYRMPMICKSLPAGTYSIQFEGYGATDIGSYSIRVRSGSVYKTLPLDSHTDVSGNITSATDIDWYTFTITTQGIYTIRANDTGTLTDANMWLYMKGTPEPLTRNEGESRAGNLTMPLICTSLSPGTYYVAVEAHTSGDQGTYGMQVFSGSDGVFYTLIDNWLGLTESISSSTDEDWYTFVVPDSQSNYYYTIYTQADPNSRPLVNGIMTLTDATGKTITTAEPSSGLPWIKKQLPAGIYYVGVAGTYSTSTGGYGIALDSSPSSSKPAAKGARPPKR